MALHVYEFDCHRSANFVASSKKQATEMFCKNVGYDSLAAYRKAERESPKITRLDDSKQVVLWLNGDETQAVSQTCREWAESCGPGLLCEDLG